MPKVTAPAEMSELSVYADGYWALMCLRDLWGRWAYAVCVCLCVGECRHMYVVWGACESVCPLNAYVIV